MRKKLFLGLAALAGVSWLIVAPGQAFGQGNTWAGASLAQMVERARWRWGNFRINAAFELSNAGYDSDIYYGYLAEPVPDVTASASTPVQVLLPLSKKIVIDLSDSPQYVFYLDTRGERAWNNTFSGRVHIALDKFYIQAGGGLANVRHRLSHELDLNIRRKEDGLSGLILWQALKSTSFALLYGTQRYEYSDIEYNGTSLAGQLNRKEDYVDFITYVQPSTLVRLSLDGQFGSYRFTEEPSGLKDAKSYGLYAAIEFAPGDEDLGESKSIQGSIKLGYKRIDMLDEQFIDGSGFVGEAGITARLTKRTSGRAFFSRGFQFSVFSGYSYYLSTSFGAGLSRRLSRKLTLSYDFSYSRSAYPDQGAGGGETPQGGYYRYLTHHASLNVRLARRLEMAFLGTFGKRIVDTSGLARNRAFVGLSLFYGSTGGGMSSPGGGAT